MWSKLPIITSIISLPLQSARPPYAAQAKLLHFIINYLLLTLSRALLSTEIRHFTQRLDIKLGFAPYKIKNLFCAKDVIPKTLRARAAFKFSCAGTCYIVETNRHPATCVREHLTTEKNSHVFQHLKESASCFEDWFSILDTACPSNYAPWEKPSLRACPRAENQAGGDTAQITDFAETRHNCWVWWVSDYDTYLRIFN